MADNSTGEKQSIKNSLKSLKKYGSTCNDFRRPEHYVTHVVQKTDTLQGIALRYNTTTELIRRVNRLYASDSLFLRDTLKVPVTKEVANSFEVNNHSNSGSTSETLTSSISTDSFTDEEDKSMHDFLGKIDNSIAVTRAQVKQVQENSNFVDPTNPTMLKKKNRHSSKSNSNSTAVNSGNNIFVAPHPVVLNKGRKVKNSLQRLEKEQDEFFEL